jgi:putative transposase
MARKPRVHFPGALYHVISRGNQRPKIFRSDRERSHYLDLLSHYQQRYDFRLNSKL